MDALLLARSRYIPDLPNPVAYHPIHHERVGYWLCRECNESSYCKRDVGSNRNVRMKLFHGPGCSLSLADPTKVRKIVYVMGPYEVSATISEERLKVVKSMLASLWDVDPTILAAMQRAMQRTCELNALEGRPNSSPFYNPTYAGESSYWVCLVCKKTGDSKPLVTNPPTLIWEPKYPAWSDTRLHLADCRVAKCVRESKPSDLRPTLEKMEKLIIYGTGPKYGGPVTEDTLNGQNPIEIDRLLKFYKEYFKQASTSPVQVNEPLKPLVGRVTRPTVEESSDKDWGTGPDLLDVRLKEAKKRQLT